MPCGKGKLSDVASRPRFLGLCRRPPGAWPARYALDATKIRQEIGWRAQVGLNDGLAATVRWYQEHFSWVERKTKFPRK